MDATGEQHAAGLFGNQALFGRDLGHGSQVVPGDMGRQHAGGLPAEHAGQPRGNPANEDHQRAQGNARDLERTRQARRQSVGMGSAEGLGKELPEEQDKWRHDQRVEHVLPVARNRDRTQEVHDVRSVQHMLGQDDLAERRGRRHRQIGPQQGGPQETLGLGQHAADEPGARVALLGQVVHEGLAGGSEHRLGPAEEPFQQDQEEDRDHHEEEHRHASPSSVEGRRRIRTMPMRRPDMRTTWNR
jgi:hypothetical protein